jgi:16S rRNA (cytosine1402-N4)-methyltransferase
MHLPVLKEEVLRIFDPKKNENFVDCTVGEGGHTFSILEKTAPDGKVLGIDWNKEVLEKTKKIAKERGLEKRLILVQDCFANLKEIVERVGFEKIKGILADLGLSSWLLKESNLGFTFLKDEPLIMRYDGNPEKLTAFEILNFWPREKIEKILRDYGEERFAKKIAKEIVNEREKGQIKSTFQLVEIIRKSVPSWYQRRKIHFATKTFQALRIAVNNELENLQRLLCQIPQVLERGGRVIIISFHSLEDKIVKNFLKKERSLKIITKKPIVPSKKEILINKSARSAKLRAAEKI